VTTEKRSVSECLVEGRVGVGSEDVGAKDVKRHESKLWTCLQKQFSSSGGTRHPLVIGETLSQLVWSFSKALSFAPHPCNFSLPYVVLLHFAFRARTLNTLEDNSALILRNSPSL